MAKTKRAKDTWRGHELITKAIFEALLKQSNPQQWEIKHNTKVVGLTATHQIDVFWRFRMADLQHIVIVQVKKEKGRAKQGDIMLFRDILRDIPGQPKGIFVSQAGFQKGALKVARTSGITALELRELDPKNRPAITITYFSIARVSLRPDILAMEWVILQATLDNLGFTVDQQWIDQYPDTWPLTPEPEEQSVSGTEFVDGDGSVRTSMRQLVQDVLRECGNGGRTQLDFTFPDATYISGVDFVNNSGELVKEKVKVLRVTADVEIVKTTTVRPWFSLSAATYMLKNAVENDTRYALVAQEGEELRAVVTVGRQTFKAPSSSIK